MLYYINFQISASNGEQIQNGNNGKNREAVVIKYLVQRIIAYAFSLSAKIS